MIVAATIWQGDDVGRIEDGRIEVERTDADEIMVRIEGPDGEELVHAWVTCAGATRLASILGIASLAHEFAAHEAAKHAGANPTEGDGQ